MDTSVVVSQVEIIVQGHYFQQVPDFIQKRKNVSYTLSSKTVAAVTSKGKKITGTRSIDIWFKMQKPKKEYKRKGAKYVQCAKCKHSNNL